MTPAALRLGSTVTVRGVGERAPVTMTVTAVRGPYRPGGAVVLTGYRPGRRGELIERTVGADRDLEVMT